MSADRTIDQCPACGRPLWDNCGCDGPAAVLLPRVRPACPVCGQVVGAVVFDQLDGVARIRHSDGSECRIDRRTGSPL